MPTVIFSDLALPELLKTCIIGIFELSNGINNVASLDINLNLKLALASFILSFSSLMILVQIFSFAFKAKVKVKDLLKFKVLQGLLSSGITYIIVQYIYMPTLPAFFNQDAYSLSNYILPSTMYMFALVVTSILSIIFFRKKRQV